MLWPAASIGTGVIGVDVHAVIGVPIHPFVGVIFLWHTPNFPRANVFVNSTPACAVGAMGYSVHIPQGAPVPPTPPNLAYWKRYLMNVLMGVVLVGLTVFVARVIAAIASLLPAKAGPVKSFINEVAGIDPANPKSTWEAVKGSYPSLTNWIAWLKFLIPPLPFPVSHGSTSVGSPNVQVNGGPLAFVAPLVANSCSDIPVVPNALTVGFSNVMVEMSLKDLARAVAVRAAQAGIAAGLQAGMKAGLNKLMGAKATSCAT